MANPAYGNLFDPVKVTAIVGDQWVNESKVVQSGIIQLNPTPLQGTKTYTLRQRRFQDTSGQAIAIGGTISPDVRTQTQVDHPIVWRYASTVESPIGDEIAAKDVTYENVSLAEEIQTTSRQYVDDSAYQTIEAVGAALTGNQVGTGSGTVSLDLVVQAKAALGERGMMFNGGAFACNSAVYWKMARLGVVAQTSNTFGINAHNAMVNSGLLPENVLGMAPLVSDKFAAVTGTQYYVYLIGQNALKLRGAGRPNIETASLASLRQFGNVTNFYVKYGIGFDGVTWGGTSSEKVTDTDLATSGNWTLSSGYNTKFVQLARLYITTT